jgi:hypothetical protein
MSRRDVHIILILILLLAGCRKNAEKQASPSGQSNPETTSSAAIPLQNEPEKVLSRFDDISGFNSEKTAEAQSSSALVDDYYRPAVHIEKPVPVRRPFILLNHGNNNASGTKNDSRLTTNDSRLTTKDFFKFGTISSGIYIAVNIDNDMWDYTDYYYTAGQSLEVYHPAISYSPLAKLLPSLRQSINFYSVNLTLNLYTPTLLTWKTVLEGDRPFSSYLVLGHRKSSLSPSKRMRMDSEFDLGVLGPYSMGRQAQDFIHENTPYGWMYQVDNDFIVNYTFRLEKGIFRHDFLDVALIGAAQAGTLYDNVSGGVFLQYGLANDRYETLFQTTPGGMKFKSRIRYYANLDLQTRLVVYDATLQGGMFNRTSIYTIPADDISRCVFTGRLGLGIGLGPYSLELEQVFLTPEFDGGKHHFWLRIRNIIHLN